MILQEYMFILTQKQIDSSTNNIIAQFYARIKKNAIFLEKYRAFAKTITLTRDKFNHNYRKLDII